MNGSLITRTRALLFAMAAVLACFVSSRAQAGAASVPAEPIVFVHGNGDDAAKWIGITWLFESNGYAADRLFSVRFTNPSARTADTVSEPDRSSTVDAASELSAFVTRVLLKTHAHKVVLIGSSRGGLTIRNYLRNAGGSAVVSAAILCGTPNHGVMVTTTGLDGEFNGGGRFLTALNGGSEVVDGVRMLTLRSDTLDKYAQPDGRASGLAQQTGVTYEGPALKGATNIVVPNADHRELAFSPAAFAEMYRFLNGHPPATLKVTPQAKVTVSGLVTGFGAHAATNIGVADVRLTVYALAPGSANRAGTAYETTTGADGAWGPVTLDSNVEYEFALTSAGRTISYFKAPLLRSTNLLNLRLVPATEDAAKGTSHLTIARPDGYFSKERDPVLMNGKPVPEEPTGLPVRDNFVAHVSGSDGVKVQLRTETIYARPSMDFQRNLSIVDLLW
ncbi:alpha/beta fold hydrolase [Terriglobus roseus]|uniref:Lipase (Class 2) n=1 Tax=Terriglobus roseus TaxID=392734 RepID=A0A1H4JX79_9BACT|nr:alpha/beta fold hydrolase [Terriglobus roseus]SEB50458.1 Lipase (class 2) [Terriglobus roseus]